MSIWNDHALGLQRYDLHTGLTGQVYSTTTLLKDGLYYINYLGHERHCFFYHIHGDDGKGAGARPLPFRPDWTINNRNVTLSRKGVPCPNPAYSIHTCDEYLLKKGGQEATGVAMAFFNYAAKDFFDVFYYERSTDRRPIAFASNIDQLPTRFDILDFASMNQTAFPVDTFMQNVHDYCH